MINATNGQQLGPAPTNGASGMSAALAATLNSLANSTASNSPPELGHLNAQMGGFSPHLNQLINTAVASPLNLAAVQQLASAHIASAQLTAATNHIAAALYSANSSIPSPGGSAFSRLPQLGSQQHSITNDLAQQFNPAPAQNPVANGSTMASIGNHLDGLFAPGSPAAALVQLKLLRNAAAELASDPGISQPQQQQQPIASVVSQLQRQVAQSEAVGQQLLLDVVNPASPMAAQLFQQHSQQRLMAAALVQQQQTAFEAAAQSQQQQQSANGLQTLTANNPRHQQQLQSDSSANSNPCSNSSGNELGGHHPIKKIRRRRPKDEAMLRRRSSPGMVKEEGLSPGEGPLSAEGTADLLQNGIKVESEEPSPANNIPMMLMGTQQFGSGAPQRQGGDELQQCSPPSLMDHQRKERRVGRSGAPGTDPECGEMMEVDSENGGQKRCKVCGDSATGYNFNVISCESCKAFFRRNALRPKEFKCPYANDCDINAVSRRFCQKCRLRKCFAVGMKKEWILSDEQLRRRKNARVKGHQSRDSGLQPSTPGSVLSASTPGSVPPQTPFADSTVGAHHGTAAPFTPPQNMFPHPQQHHSPLSAQIFSPNNDAMRSFLQQQQATNALMNGGGAHSPLTLAALTAAAAKLVASPNQSPGNGGLMGVDPMAPTMGNSPRGAATLLESKPSSVASLGSPPSLLPIPHEQQQLLLQQLNDANSAPLQQLANAMIQRARRASGGPDQLGLGAQQPASVSPGGLSPLIESWKHLLQQNSPQQAVSATPVNAMSLNFAPDGTPSTLLNSFSPLQQLNSHPLGDTAQNCTASNSDAATSSTAAAAEQVQQSAPMQFAREGMQQFFNMRIQHTIQTVLDEDTSAAPPNNDTPINTPGPMDDRSSRNNSFSIPIRDLRAFQLNSLEQSNLKAIKVAFASMDEDMRAEMKKNERMLSMLTKQDQGPTDMMSVIDLVMRRFVKMAKKLPSFNELSHSGKFSLLKAAMIDLLTLRGASRMDLKDGCWKSQLNKDFKCKIDIFDKLNDGAQKNRVINFYNELHETLRNDSTANNLVILTFLFNHHTDTALSAEDKAVAERHHENHKDLLKRYLESVHGPEEARQIFDTVPEAFKKLHDVVEKAKDIFKGAEVEKREETKFAEEFFPTCVDDKQKDADANK